MGENNDGFGIAFATIIFVAFILPSIVLLSVGDTWARFIDKYGSAVPSVKTASMKRFVEVIENVDLVVCSA